MAILHEEEMGTYRLTVRANCALSWQLTRYLMWFFVACFAAVGTYFAAIGAWLVLPFAGLELAVLIGGFYMSALSGHVREVIEIRGSDVRISRGGRRLKEIATLSRYWTRVSLVRDPRGWHPSRLLLRSHGRNVEIVTRLIEAEREHLASELSARMGVRAATVAAERDQAVKEHDRDQGLGLREGEAHAMTRIQLPSDGK